MSWKWNLGRWAGIDIFAHWTLLLMMVAVGLSWTAQGAGWMGFLIGFGCMGSLFGLVTLHEFGHALTARRFGIRTRDITLLPIGGLARLEGMPRRPLHEMLIAAAGPAVNLVLAGVTVLLAQLPGPWWWQFLTAFSLEANLMLALFNLLPAFPMDGGRILRAGLALSGKSLLVATEQAVKVSRVTSVLIGLYGLVTGSLWLAVLAVYVWLAATFELMQVRSGSGGMFGGLQEARVVAWQPGRGPVVVVVGRR